MEVRELLGVLLGFRELLGLTSDFGVKLATGSGVKTIGNFSFGFRLEFEKDFDDGSLLTDEFVDATTNLK